MPTYDGSGTLEEDIDHLLPGEPVQFTVTAEYGGEVWGPMYLSGEGISKREIGHVSAFSEGHDSRDEEPADSAYVTANAPNQPGTYDVWVENSKGENPTGTLTVEDPATVGDTGQNATNEDAETATERALDSDEVMGPHGGDVDLDTLEGVSETEDTRSALGLPDREQATPGELSELTDGGGGFGAIVLVLALLAGAAALLGGDN